MNAAELASKIGAVPAGRGEWKTLCPTHEDHEPSLWFRDGDKGLVFVCRSGCDKATVFDAVKAAGWLENGNGNVGSHQSRRRSHAPVAASKLSDNSPQEEEIPPRIPVPENALEELDPIVERMQDTLGPFVSAWQYHTREGGIQFVVVRWAGKHGKKEVRPFYYGIDSRWHCEQPFHDRPLYRLHELVKSDLPVLIVEGEKCADVEVPGYFVTTWSGGSGGVLLTDWSALDGRVVTIWPDADTPGAKSALAVKYSLPHARILEVPSDKPKTWDIADAAEEGEDLIAFITEHLPPADEGEVAAPEANTKDYGHAKTLEPFFRGRYRWAVHSKTWMHYDGKRWRRIPEERLVKLAADALRREYSKQGARAKSKSEVADMTRLMNESCTVSRVSGALEFLKGWPNIITTADQWDADPWALNVNTGTVDLHTGELRDHRPEDLLTKLAPVDFDPDATTEKWQAHLDLFLPEKNVQRQLQRDLGLALPGVTLEEWFDIWWGSGKNGKTTTSRVIQEVLGDYTKRAAPNLLIQSKWDRHPTELAALEGARLVFSVEVDRGNKLAESRIKELTGGDGVEARGMYQDFRPIKATFSFIMLVNHKPQIEGTDEGTWRRVRLIPWTETISAEAKRPQEEVVNELVSEGPGVLNWILAGLRDWQTDHDWMAEDVQIVTEAYREESDKIGPFLRLKCERSPRYEVAVSELHNAYLTWCAEQQEDPISKREFDNLVREHGFSTKPRGKSNIVHWQGIRIFRRVEASPTSVKSPRESNPGEVIGNQTRQNSPSLETPPTDFWETHDRDDPEHPLV